MSCLHQHLQYNITSTLHQGLYCPCICYRPPLLAVTLHLSPLSLPFVLSWKRNWPIFGNFHFIVMLFYILLIKKNIGHLFLPFWFLANMSSCSIQLAMNLLVFIIHHSLWLHGILLHICSKISFNTHHC